MHNNAMATLAQISKSRSSKLYKVIINLKQLQNILKCHPIQVIGDGNIMNLSLPSLATIYYGDE